jgi:hypothetical protein
MGVGLVKNERCTVTERRSVFFDYTECVGETDAKLCFPVHIRISMKYVGFLV